MRLFENFFGEGCFRIFVEDGDSGLQNDRAGVEIFVDEMHGAAGEFDAVFEGLALRFEAGEGREQRRVNIQDAVWIFGDEKGREQAHVSCQADEINSVFVENGGNFAVVDFALEEDRADLICLAGYMRVLSAFFVDRKSTRLNSS